MNPRLFDVHTHTQFAAFTDDKDSVIRRALDTGVWIVNVGTQIDTSKNAIETAAQYPGGVYATVGLHPIHTNKSFHDTQELGGTGEFTSRGETFEHDAYKTLALHPKVVAIGECGLDYYRLQPESKEKQISVFEDHVMLAHEVKKPLVIHCRQAFDDLIDVLNKKIDTLNRENPGIIHFFSGTKENVEALLRFGFSFSFGGVITFARDYDTIIREIPLDRILLETDAPYISPAPYRGKRNEPLYVEEVAKKLAEIKGISLKEISQKTTENALRVFGLANS